MSTSCSLAFASAVSSTEICRIALGVPAGQLDKRPDIGVERRIRRIHRQTAQEDIGLPQRIACSAMGESTSATDRELPNQSPEPLKWNYVLLLLDRSPAMVPVVARLKSEAAQSIARLERTDHVGVVLFDDNNFSAPHTQPFRPFRDSIRNPVSSGALLLQTMPGREG